MHIFSLIWNKQNGHTWKSADEFNRFNSHIHLQTAMIRRICARDETELKYPRLWTSYYKFCVQWRWPNFSRLLLAHSSAGRIIAFSPIETRKYQNKVQFNEKSILCFSYYVKKLYGIRLWYKRRHTSDISNWILFFSLLSEKSIKIAVKFFSNQA